MLFYNLTLHKATGITHAICGNFCGLYTQDIAVSRGKILELLRYNSATEEIETICSTDLFAIIRSIGKYRQPSGILDRLIIGCDSGKFIVLEYSIARNVFFKVFEDKFSKNACRRDVPGQFLAVDPLSRAAMIAAVENKKLVYILNLEVPKRVDLLPELHTILYDVVALNGYENPVFACLEMKYENGCDPGNTEVLPAQQTLTYYEYKPKKEKIEKKSEPLSRVGNLLISVPGGNQGPGGVLICSENYLTYKNLGEQPEIRCPIPRRKNDLDDPERSIIFCCSVTHTNANMPGCLVLAQTEQGDIYSITFKTEKEVVTEIRLKYFDTIAVASAMCIVENCYLFVASEFGNHGIYKFGDSVEEYNEQEFSSSVVPLGEDMTFAFCPRPLKSLYRIKELESLSPIIDCQVGDLYNMNIPQIYLACGRGPRSTLRVLKHAVQVETIQSTELAENPNGCWALEPFVNGEFHSYVVLSYEHGTSVMSAGAAICEISDLGFLLKTKTFCCSRFKSNKFVQVHPDGVRLVEFSHNIRSDDWQFPEDKKVTLAAMNEQQIVLIMSGIFLVYITVNIMASTDTMTVKDLILSKEVTCIALSPVCFENQWSMILAVVLDANILQLISLYHTNSLDVILQEELPSAAESITIAQMHYDMYNEGKVKSHLVLYVGLKNGMLLQKCINQDNNTVSMYNTSEKHLGDKPVKLFKIQIQGIDAVIASSDSSWLSYCCGNDLLLAPLWHETLSFACNFPSHRHPDSFIAVTGKKLSVMRFTNLNLNQCITITPLKYTPRKFVLHPETSRLFVIETDHGAYTEQHKKQLEKHIQTTKDQAFSRKDIPEHIFGAPKAGLGMWASAISIIDPTDGRTISEVDLEQNEAATSLLLLNFEAYADVQFLLVGVVKDLQICPRKCSGGAVHTYKVSSDGNSLELFHKTEVNEAPGAICSFQGMVLIGVGNLLRLYTIGKEKLLRKVEFKLPNNIVTIHATGNRIVVSDVQEGFFFILYKPKENQLVLFSRDTNVKRLTASTLIDSDTVACADKFGNIHVVKLPSSVSDEVDEEGPNSMISSIQNGTCPPDSFQKVHLMCSFYVGEMVHSLKKVVLLPGSSESLLYTTLSGSVGVFAPFTCDKDEKFFQHLEMRLRKEYPSLCGRDHLSFRSSYFPVMNVIDGDLCEKFHLLDPSLQSSIALSLNAKHNEVSAKLRNMRAKYAF